jgi:hypothetical protein
MHHLIAPSESALGRDILEPVLIAARHKFAPKALVLYRQLFLPSKFEQTV